MNNKHHLPPSRLAASRRRGTRNRALLVAGGVLALLAALIVIARLPALQVKEIVVIGNEVTTDEELRAVVHENLRGNYWFVFPKSNIFLYPRTATENAIKSALARVSAASVSSADLSTISIEIRERHPDALWCEGEYDPHDPVPHPCYFVDSDGLIFAEAPLFSGNVFVRYYGLYGGVPVGRQLLELATYREEAYFLQTLPKFSLEPTDVILHENNDVTVYLMGDARLLFNRTHSLGEVLQNLDSVLSSEPLEGRESLELDYIDLRFGNKIFYRLK